MSFLSLLGFGVKKDAVSPTDELAHINQEMYKKSVELNERNKTLSLLQKIDEVILSNIVHLDDVAQKVSSLLVQEIDFQQVSLFLYDKKAGLLKRIAFSQAASQVPQEEPLLEIPFTDTQNLIVQAVNEKTTKYAGSLENVLPPQATQNTAIGSAFLSPLLVRGEVIGALVIGVAEAQEELTQYRKDLFNRLSKVIGIAFDNALLYSEVQEANEKLKTLDKLKDEFVSLASHELRTPMTAIKSYLWMALDGRGGVLTEKQKYYMERAYFSADRLIKLVNDMLNISRIESGRITVVMKTVDLQKLTDEVIEEVTPRATEVGVVIERMHGDGIPPVFADSDKIKEVLFNLVGNSLKFTPKGGKITVTFVHSGDMIETKILDTGSGIEPDDLSKLFQKFGLIEGSYTTNQTASGTGLGLYICKSIIELHKGKIWAKSEGRGKGSEFTFSLKVFDEAQAKELGADNQTVTQSVGLVHAQL